MNQEELMHYGVKGMKWGVRRDKYERMGSQERQKVRKAYRAGNKVARKNPKTSEQRLIRNRDRGESIGIILAGPVGGLVGAAIGSAYTKRKYNVKINDIDRQLQEIGMEYLLQKEAQKAARKQNR